MIPGINEESTKLNIVQGVHVSGKKNKKLKI